jgi:hypothetical protein
MQPHLGLPEIIDADHLLRHLEMPHLFIELLEALQHILVEVQQIRVGNGRDLRQPGGDFLGEHTDDVVAALHARQLAVVEVVGGNQSGVVVTELEQVFQPAQVRAVVGHVLVLLHLLVRFVVPPDWVPVVAPDLLPVL